MAKKRVNRYPKAFRLMALGRMKSCDNVSELARELREHGSAAGDPADNLQFEALVSSVYAVNHLGLQHPLDESEIGLLNRVLQLTD